MSGYLQRIASGVLNPTTAIHPMVGSIWSAPRKVEPPETGVSESLTGNRARATSTESDDALHSRRHTMQQEIHDTGRFAEGAARDTGPFPEAIAKSGTVEHARTASEPRAIPATPAFHPLVAKQVEANAGSIQPIEPVNSAQPDEALRPETSERFAAARFRPLIHPVILPGDSEKARASLPPYRAPNRLDQRIAARPLTLSQAVNEPDEIQIHIGRIEVMAAPPQPAPRPVVKPRKSVDLSEYLKRDRRTR